MNESKTGCECPLAGYCQKHGINKSAHFHKLCQNHQGYFDMWEKCKGPGQNPNDCTPKSKPVEEKAIEEPSLLQKARNFIPAVIKQAVAGNPQASQEKIDERLSLCRECPFFDSEKIKCKHCGCPLISKTKWETSSCPIGRW